jgi:hypothetical protein
LELQKQLAASKGSSQKPLLDVPADQELNSLRPGQALVGLGAIDQAKMKPSGGGNPLTPLGVHEVLVEARQNAPRKGIIETSITAIETKIGLLRGRQLQSRAREAVIPAKEDFDWLLCQMADIWRRSSGHGQYTTQICKQSESRLNAC